MKCPRCQRENPTGQKFCGECGVRLASPCPSCSATNPPGQKFCGECGASLTDAPTKKFASPESYTPKHLAEKILTSKAALEGERKQVTVLFADLKGSMELLADRDPEEARKILDPVLEQMMEAVHRYEGTVNQVMGDGIMALFGAPLAHEDHAVRACYAALRMQERVKKYADEVRRSHAAVVKIRVGLNSGQVVVRAIGSDLHMDYTAVGQTTHLAARMEQLADPGAIVITPETLALVEGYVEVKSLGPVPVKGLAEPVEAYEMTATGAVRTRLQASAARGLSRFVGRDTEMEHLRSALEQAGQGQGQVVALVGEPGVGKSRLFYEFTRSHRLHRWQLLEGRSVSYGTATSYLPVIDLLKSYFKIQDRDGQREIREKVTGKLFTLDEGLRPILTALLALLDVPIDDPAWQAFDPPQRRQRTLDAVKRLLLRESQAQPLVLVFEDLHWADAETQALFDSLVDSLPTTRTLLLVNYRPEYQHGWGSKTYYTQLRIDTLPPETAEEFLRALLGDDPGLQPLKRLLIERTEGNPFFLEETVRSLVETKVLHGERGAYRPARAIESMQVPAMVHGILAARIDRLAPEDKALLQSASVIGKDFPFVLLEAIADLSGDALLRGLAHLQGAEFVYERSLFPELEYTFKHALTHEVAYASLLQERRRALHVEILEAMEALYPERLVELAERLATHAVAGERWDKAVSHLWRAARKALTRSANRQAAEDFHQALGTLERLPRTRETIEQAIDMRLELRDVLIRLGETARLPGLLTQAEALAASLQDQRRLARAQSCLSDYFWIVGEHRQALAAAQSAVEITRLLSDPALRMEAAFDLGQGYHALGWYREAMRCFDAAAQNVALKTPDDPLTALFVVLSRAWLAWSQAECGAFEAADQAVEDALYIAEVMAQPWTKFHAYLGAGLVHLTRGTARHAVGMLERALQECHEGNLLLGFPFVMAPLGASYLLVGRQSEATTLLERAVREAEAINFLAFQSRRTSWLASCLLASGRIEEAHAVAQRALDLALKHEERANEAYAWHLIGDVAICSERSDAQTAEDSYTRALALATDVGAHPLVAHCHLGLGKLHRRTGKRQEAQEHLTTATTMYREMDMRFWLEQAEGEVKELE